MSRTAAFERIKRSYKQKDDALMALGRLPMRSTSIGFWGTTNLDDFYAWMKKMCFPPGTRFIDLGSGDGRLVLVASLFVEAAGIEHDSSLVEEGACVAEELGMAYPVKQGDYRDEELSGYDVWFMYADQRMDSLEMKFIHELKGSLYLYHDTFHPFYLKKRETVWVGLIPFFKYSQ